MVAWNDIFLERFAETVRPLRDLANTNGKYIWLPMQEEIFNKVKTQFSNSHLNNYFELHRVTYLFTGAGKPSNDESNKHVGFSAILMQQDEKGQYLPIQFASRNISPVEAKYFQLELESEP